MKREELIKRLYTHKIIGDKDLMQILEEAGFKDYAISSIINKIADITNAPLPPAEGAEKVQWSGYGELGNISQKPLQPTAEGAEEFLLAQRNGNNDPITVAISKDGWVYKMIVKAMEGFATLHAQRLAEKMVEEKMREELIKFMDWVNNTFCEGNMSNILDAEDVDEYLKSKEQ